MSLRQQAFSGAASLGVSSATQQVLAFGKAVVLARLLTPDDFGLMAMLMVPVGFTLILGDMGLGNAAIHRKDVLPEQLSSLYWFQVGIGLLLATIIWKGAPLIAALYVEPRLVVLALWASLFFLITPFGLLFQAVLQKDLRFHQLAFIDLGSAIVHAGAAIFLACLGFGVFSLIWGQLAGVLARTLLLVACGLRLWKPSLRFRVRDFHGFARFGFLQTGERSVNHLATHVDYLIIGRFMGPQILGLYRLAYELVVLPLVRFAPVVTRVAFPVFAKRQDDLAALAKGFIEVSRLMAMALFPYLAVLVTLAPAFMGPVFGARWLPAAVLVQALAGVGLAKGLANPTGSIFLATGRVGLSFAWNLGVTVLLAIALYLAIPYGVFAVSVVYSAMTAVFLAALVTVLIRRVLPLRLTAYVVAFRSPALATLALLAVLWCGRYLATAGNVPGTPGMLVALALAGLAYLSILFVLERPLLAEVRRMFPTSLHRT